MSGRDRIDLSGEWTGVYNYPVAIPPVPFEAVILDSEGRISGTTTEKAPTAFSPSQRLDAVIDGRREGRTVHFLKMYDQAGEDYDVVQYSGRVDSEGGEIAGDWRLAGMSGTFLMVRRSRSAEGIERQIEEKVDG